MQFEDVTLGSGKLWWIFFTIIFAFYGIKDQLIMKKIHSTELKMANSSCKIFYSNTTGKVKYTASTDSWTKHQWHERPLLYPIISKVQRRNRRQHKELKWKKFVVKMALVYLTFSYFIISVYIFSGSRY